MKTLLLLRHAKSSWKDESLDDHDRPLNKRGKREAPRMGQLLKDEGLLPELIVSSSARRARKTAEHVIHASGYRGETRITSEAYDAAPEKLLELLATVPEPLSRVLLVGHNPGLEELLQALIGTYTPLSTASLAHLGLPIAAWSEIAGKPQGTLKNLWQPRELE
jgi:phosphohistidine phosphatase